MGLEHQCHVFLICALFRDSAAINLTGIVVFLGLFLTFLHANSVLKNQVGNLITQSLLLSWRLIRSVLDYAAVAQKPRSPGGYFSKFNCIHLLYLLRLL